MAFPDCRVCGRNQTGDHADRNRDDTQSLLIVALKLADGLHILDVLIDTPACKYVFDHLVVDLAEAGVFLRHLGQTLRVAHAGVRNAADDVINLRLIHTGQFALGFLRGFHQLSDLLNRHQILINQFHMRTLLFFFHSRAICLLRNSVIFSTSSSFLAKRISCLVMLSMPSCLAMSLRRTTLRL